MTQLSKTSLKTICECCDKSKLCHLYVLQDGSTAWVCDDCREGKKK